MLSPTQHKPWPYKVTLLKPFKAYVHYMLVNCQKALLCSWHLLAGVGRGLRSVETVRDGNSPRSEEGPVFSAWGCQTIVWWRSLM